MMRSLMLKFMGSCEESQELQWKRLKEDLQPCEGKQLRRHLSFCRDCRDYQAKLERARDRLLEEGEVELDRSFKLSAEAKKRLQNAIAQAEN